LNKTAANQYDLKTEYVYERSEKLMYKIGKRKKRKEHMKDEEQTGNIIMNYIEEITENKLI